MGSGSRKSEVLENTEDPARGARIIFPRAFFIVARVGMGRLNKERSIGWWQFVRRRWLWR